MAELKKTLIVLVGPTAVGKTSLSIELAQELDCPIISTDSRQFYKEMTIGTAKPTAEELNQAEHHFINSRSIHDRYTAGMFEADAISTLNKIFQNHDVCIAVGGSGLYINALCYGIDDIPASDEVREVLHKRWKTEGLESLQEEVKQIDPEFYENSDMQNPRRVMRALEVYILTGKKYSSYRKNQNKKRPFNCIWLGLEMDTEVLYERINQRVDKMVENGLIEEVRSLLPHKDLKSMKTVGYQEIVDFLEHKTTKEQAIELVKRNSRRFAKKQFTWFRKNEEVRWFKPGQNAQILDYIQANKCN
jgi:tRNA dimethylallyltransferase